MIKKNHSQAIPALAKIWFEVLGSSWMPNISTTEIERWLNKMLSDKNFSSGSTCASLKFNFKSA